MTIALWIIAACEVIRIIQNTLQLLSIKHDTGARDNAYAAFVDSLKMNDREFVARILKEFDKNTDDGR